jgi:hypothetical protein
MKATLFSSHFILHPSAFILSKLTARPLLTAPFNRRDVRSPRDGFAPPEVVCRRSSHAL